MVNWVFRFYWIFRFIGFFVYWPGFSFCSFFMVYGTLYLPGPPNFGGSGGSRQ